MWFDLLTFAVPMNMGSLEGSRIVVFRSVGYAALPGMAYGLAIRFAQIFWSLLGLAIYGHLTARERIGATGSQNGANPVETAPRMLLTAKLQE